MSCVVGMDKCLATPYVQGSMALFQVVLCLLFSRQCVEICYLAEIVLSAFRARDKKVQEREEAHKTSSVQKKSRSISLNMISNN